MCSSSGLFFPAHSFLISFSRQCPRQPGPCPRKDSSGLSLNLSGTAGRRAPARPPAPVSVSGVSQPEPGRWSLAESLTSRGLLCPGGCMQSGQSSSMAESHEPKNDPCSKGIWKPSWAPYPGQSLKWGSHVATNISKELT